MRTAGLAIAIFAFGLVSYAAAQEKLDFTISSGAVFGKSVSPATSSVTLSPHFSGLYFGTVRYHFSHLQAVEVNLSHMNTAEIFSRPPDTYKITGGVFEYSVAYVLTPFHDHRLQPFLLAGGGGLRWNVGNQYIDQVQVNIGAYYQKSLAFLYGGGVDYPLWRRLALRVQYRGLVYRAPNFTISNLFISGKDHIAEPAAGLVFHF